MKKKYFYLKYMKNALYLFTLILLTLSCSSINKTIENSEEEKFVLSYKKSVLNGCINEATNNKFNEFSNENNDLGLAIEIEIMQHQEVIDAVNKGKELSKKIRTINYSDFEGKKPIFSDCVSLAFSQETDSLARIAFKNKEIN